jgi:hypothetical protein
VICRWARSWLAIAIRALIKSLRARTVIRNDSVASESRVNGRSRDRSVRKVSASTNPSKRSSLFPADP